MSDHELKQFEETGDDFHAHGPGAFCILPGPGKEKNRMLILMPPMEPGADPVQWCFHISKGADPEENARDKWDWWTYGQKIRSTCQRS